MTRRICRLGFVWTVNGTECQSDSLHLIGSLFEKAAGSKTAVRW